MYAREKVGLDPAWRGRLLDFFQYLTQAATKVPTCAIVASLLATDPHKSDTLGRELTQELYAIFRREREQSVQPVLKEDVAEVLRRRFFTPDSIRDRSAFRPQAVAALKGIATLDEQTGKEMKAAEERFVQSYPFHPDLTELFYSKWTNMESFQRTRGILRTFALALRDASKWDECPLVSTNVFIGEPGKSALSESARELTNVAETDEYEGKKQEWTGILEGELAKARDLLLLLGPTHPDKIELEKALQRWTEVSWFLDESTMQNIETNAAGSKLLPKAWRLGFRPNLRQMHHDATSRISLEVIEERLRDEIRGCKSLASGAGATGARVHMLPERPRDIEDDGEFHYAILGPKAVSSANRPNPEARRYLDEKSGPDSPRVYRNALVLAVPSVDGVEATRNAIRDSLGWLDVEEQLKGQDIDSNRRLMLDTEKKKAAALITDMVRQAYCLVATVSERNEAQVFKVVVGDEPLFNIIKRDSRSRIQETPVTAEALLPGGPYDLWREGESAHRMKDLVEAFAQRTQLPKMLNRKAIADTLLEGCREGLFVFRAARPDHSARTFWRELPDEMTLKEPAIEVLLPEAADLASVPAALLAPGVLPDLWHGDELALRDLRGYFTGRVITLQYGETMTIPTASRSVIDAAIQTAVREKRLWLVTNRASFFAEELPLGVLGEDASLLPPPQPVSPREVLPASLPEAWSGELTTALALATALSTKAGKSLPWITVRDVIDGAFRARLLERTVDSGSWPCDYAGARAVKVCMPHEQPAPQPGPHMPPPTAPTILRESPPETLVATAILQPGEIQNLNDQLGDLVKAAVGLNLQFQLRVELGPAAKLSHETVDKVNELLSEVSEKLVLRGF